ncbi:testis-expressed protein 26 isoform 2-T2 [Spinachia spinachia]
MGHWVVCVAPRSGCYTWPKLHRLYSKPLSTGKKWKCNSFHRTENNHSTRFRKLWSPMATKEGKQWWDPYETSNRRQFICHPKSVAEILMRPTSTSFVDSSLKSGPFGSPVYNRDFCWKPPCKSECICTGTASGQRRNNPHPSQSFMKWSLPRDGAQSSEYVGVPWECHPSEGEICMALTAQYSSIYRCDYTGQAHHNMRNGRIPPWQSWTETALPAGTDMRENDRLPMQKPGLLRNYSPYSCTAPSMGCCGIVPTVVQRHAQQKRSHLTNYDRFCGKTDMNVPNMMKSLLPQELQHLCRTLPKEEKESLKQVMTIDANQNNGDKVNKLPPVELHSGSPKGISSWPGPF